jgi:Tetratricopeptide repeat
MNRKRDERGPSKRGKPGRPKGSAPGGPKDVIHGEEDTARLALRRVDGKRFSLQAPPCARERSEDLDEVHKMISAGETEIARDELLYLVADCRGFLDAHNLLGEMAVEEGDLSLAQGHFGFAYEIGLGSLPEGFQGILPAHKDYNKAFFLAGRGLARCLIARGKPQEGREVLNALARFDPREASVRALLDELNAGQST